MAAHRPLLFLTLLTLLTLGMCALGCVTSMDVVANPIASGKQYRSAYLVAHGDRSSDVDAAIQRELFRRGLAVSSGEEGKHPATAELIVKYADEWKPDFVQVMYLHALYIQIYDAASGNMVASGRWTNSPIYGFHGLDKVVGELVADMFKKLGISKAA